MPVPPTFSTCTSNSQWLDASQKHQPLMPWFAHGWVLFLECLHCPSGKLLSVLQTHNQCLFPETLPDLNSEQSWTSLSIPQGPLHSFTAHVTLDCHCHVCISHCHQPPWTLSEGNGCVLYIFVSSGSSKISSTQLGHSNDLFHSLLKKSQTFLLGAHLTLYNLKEIWIVSTF